HALVPALVLVLAAAPAVAVQRPPSGPAVALAAELRSMQEAPSPRAARRPCSDWPRAPVPALVPVLAAAPAVALQRRPSGAAVAWAGARRPMREAPSPRAARRPCSDWPRAPAPVQVSAWAWGQAVTAQRP